MSTEQEIGVSVWPSRTRSFMREESGSLRYLAFNGFCTNQRPFFLAESLTFSWVIVAFC